MTLEALGQKARAVWDSGGGVSPVFPAGAGRGGEEDMKQSPIQVALWQEREEPGTKLG